MSLENRVERALTDYAGAVSAGEPDVEALVARGTAARRRHRTRIVACVGAVAVMVSAAVGPIMWRGAEPAPVTPPEVTTGTPPRNLGIPWGPDVTYYLVDDVTLSAPYGGRPFADTQPWRGVDLVQSFTTISTGVVYVNAGGEIVFKGWDHQTRVLGRNPRMSEHENSQLLGNPAHDVVAWAEDEGERIAVVVARPSTGETLARTLLPAPTESHVYVRSLDAERLHVWVNSEQDPKMWTWKWSTKETPTSKDGGRVLDAANRVWVVMDEADQWLRFGTDSGRLIRRVPGSFGEGGGNLSPDGKIWYNRGHNKFLDLATGRVWSFKENAEFQPETPGEVAPHGPDDQVPNRNRGWTGATEITFVIEENASTALVSCDVVTLRCTKPLHPQLPAGSYRYRDVTLPSH